MNNSTSKISRHIRGFDIGISIFLIQSRYSVLPSIRLTPNKGKICRNCLQ
jgi:hypothetical protein